jgi:hypothetical protein
LNYHSNQERQCRAGLGGAGGSASSALLAWGRSRDHRHGPRQEAEPISRERKWRWVTSQLTLMGPTMNSGGSLSLSLCNQHASSAGACCFFGLGLCPNCPVCMDASNEEDLPWQMDPSEQCCAVHCCGGSSIRQGRVGGVDRGGGARARHPVNHEVMIPKLLRGNVFAP